MRTCVNLHSAEIKFAAGTASFLREWSRPFSSEVFHETRAHAAFSTGGIEPRLPRPPTSRTEVLNPAGLPTPAGFAF